MDYIYLYIDIEYIYICRQITINVKYVSQTMEFVKSGLIGEKIWDTP